jgi:hypothetical protein
VSRPSRSAPAAARVAPGRVDVAGGHLERQVRVALGSRPEAVQREAQQLGGALQRTRHPQVVQGRLLLPHGGADGRVARHVHVDREAAAGVLLGLALGLRQRLHVVEDGLRDRAHPLTEVSDGEAFSHRGLVGALVEDGDAARGEYGAGEQADAAGQQPAQNAFSRASDDHHAVRVRVDA